MKLSTHGKERLYERAQIDKNNQKQFVKAALKNGLSYRKAIEKGYDPDVFNYIAKREDKYRCKVKLYKEYTFCYGKNSKILYTMYKTPQNVLYAIKAREER